MPNIGPHNARSGRVQHSNLLSSPHGGQPQSHINANRMGYARPDCVRCRLPPRILGCAVTSPPDPPYQAQRTTASQILNIAAPRPPGTQTLTPLLQESRPRASRAAYAPIPDHDKDSHPHVTHNACPVSSRSDALPKCRAAHLRPRSRLSSNLQAPMSENAHACIIYHISYLDTVFGNDVSPRRRHSLPPVLSRMTQTRTRNEA
ncbi:hypothetical protein BS17DRAFT_815822 [Gyrodon lividus]|nr:hypothetical protein BS17DRAFT_815822 [Gyrodon lividus]